MSPHAPEAPRVATVDSPTRPATSGTAMKPRKELVTSERLQRPRRLLTLQETAELLAISVGSARRLIAMGALPAVRFNRRVKVDLRDLERLIEQAKMRLP